MRVAVFATNPRGIYSGGRYASLIMAYALARAGVETTYVTDNVPMFDSDFAVYDLLVSPLRKVVHPRLEYTGEAAEWVIIIPSGGVTDLVYDAAEQYATRARSRVALFSFETPNWFNSLSAYPKVALAWEAWRRCMARGGLVLTIAQEGIKPAREFYYSPHRRAALEFAFWHPPINDLVADAVQPSEYRSKVVAFVRTQDAHKGAADILRLDPSILSGYTLALVFGYSADSKYLEAVRAHFSGAAVKG